MKTPLEILSDYSNNIKSIYIYFIDILHQYYIDIYKIHGVYPPAIVPPSYSINLQPPELEDCINQCTDFDIDNEYLYFCNVANTYQCIPLTKLFRENKA